MTLLCFPQKQDKQFPPIPKHCHIFEIPGMELYLALNLLFDESLQEYLTQEQKCDIDSETDKIQGEQSNFLHLAGSYVNRGNTLWAGIEINAYPPSLTILRNAEGIYYQKKEPATVAVSGMLFYQRPIETSLTYKRLAKRGIHLEEVISLLSGSRSGTVRGTCVDHVDGERISARITIPSPQPLTRQELIENYAAIMPLTDVYCASFYGTPRLNVVPPEEEMIRHMQKIDRDKPFFWNLDYTDPSLKPSEVNYAGRLPDAYVVLSLFLSARKILQDIVDDICDSDQLGPPYWKGFVHQQTEKRKKAYVTENWEHVLSH